MRWIVMCALLALAACAADDAAPDRAADAVAGWRTAVGQRPSRAEFAAVYAACQDRVRNAAAPSRFDGCLADLGLHRVQQE
jgi:hypothetical protein